MDAVSSDGCDGADANALRVALVGRDSLQRRALRQLVGRRPSLQLVAVAASPSQLDPQAAIDVLLAEPGDPPDERLIDAALATELPLVVLLRLATAREIEAIHRGGATVLPADTGAAALAAALHCAAAGLIALAPAQLGSAATASAVLPELLTARECEVLSLLAEGLPNRGIASALAISTHTAKFHVAQILAKLQATSRAQAVAIALREGLIGAAARVDDR